MWFATVPVIGVLVTKLATVLAYQVTPTCGLSNRFWAFMSPAINDIAGLRNLSGPLIIVALVVLLFVLKTKLGKAVISFVLGIVVILMLIYLVDDGLLASWLPSANSTC